jgi:hypothetical protein
MIEVILEERKETMERRRRRSSPLVARPGRPAPIPGDEQEAERGEHGTTCSRRR